MTGAADWLTPEVAGAVIEHMNTDHAGDCLLIVRRAGGVAGAVSARATGVDLQSMIFTARLADGMSVQVPIPFSRPLRQRADIRAEVVRLHQLSGGSPPEHRE